MTDERLAELERLATNATKEAPLPWRAEYRPRYLVLSADQNDEDEYYHDPVANPRDDTYGTYIAAACTAVPELVAEVRRLRKIVAAIPVMYESEARGEVCVDGFMDLTLFRPPS